MTNRIVTGNSLEGQIGNLHQEDIVLDFAGSRPDQLINGCYYRGTVDGYADFGVFVDIGEHVTGLLHRSELPRRIESLDWEAGDTVYVQVKNVRDNGNVDLGWSIRTDKTEFRGSFVHDPSGELDPADLDEASPSDEPDEPDEPDDSQSTVKVRPASAGDTTSEGAVESDAETADGTSQTQSADTGFERIEIERINDRVGDVVRLEGTITDVRQTSGPTVFELRDETGSVDCAAFDGAGVRAYPEVDTDDVVRIDGEVRERRGELQIETEQLSVLEDDAATVVSERMASALTTEAEASAVAPLASDTAVEDALEDVRAAATAIRRAVLESRPVIVRHNATVDGYLAGAALERAVLPLVSDEHVAADAGYHYFDRRPLEGVYDMADATNDVTAMLEAKDRHEQNIPLFVFAATGASRDSLDGFDLLRIYDAETVVIDGGDADGAVTDAVRTVVNPGLAGSDEDTSATALASAVAVHVNDDVRDDLRHLPAASFWEDTPEAYVDLAADADYRTKDIERLQEALALEAYYQSYEDKREIVTDLLFEESSDLTEQVSEQFREKLESEVETAEENIERRSEGGVAFAVLDTDAFTHRFDFPPTPLLLDEIHRRNRDGTFVTLGVGEDEIDVRSTVPVDLREVATRTADAVPNGGVTARGGHNRIEFVVGERDAVLEAVVEAIAETV